MTQPNSPPAFSRFKTWGLGFLILVVVANSLFPYLWILISSVKPTNIMYATPTVWFFTPIADHYISAFGDKGFGANFVNSMIVSVSTTALAIASAASRWKFDPPSICPSTSLER